VRGSWIKLAKVACILILAVLLAAVVIIYAHVRPALIEF
jgi:hypothetical protein